MGPAPTPPDLTLAEARVDALSRHRHLSEDDLLWCLDMGRWADALVVVARLAGTPIDVVMRCFGLPDVDAALVILRLAGMSWPAAEAVVQYRAGGGDAGGAIAREAEAYQQLSRAAAERALRFICFRTNVTVIAGS
jgi:hypothetical protein